MALIAQALVKPISIVNWVLDKGSVLIFMQRPMKELFGEQISILHMQHMPTKLLNIVRPNIIFMMIVLKNCSTNLIYLCLIPLAYMGSGAGLAMKTN